MWGEQGAAQGAAWLAQSELCGSSEREDLGSKPAAPAQLRSWKDWWGMPAMIKIPSQLSVQMIALLGGNIKPLTLFLYPWRDVNKRDILFKKSTTKRVGDIDVGLVPSSLRIRVRGRKKPVTYSDFPSLTTFLWVSLLKDLSHALTSWQQISHAFSKSQTAKPLRALGFAFKLDINR